MEDLEIDVPQDSEFCSKCGIQIDESGMCSGCLMLPEECSCPDGR
jgi:hypothetical protein